MDESQTQQKGAVIVISSVSGGGKTTLIHRLLERSERLQVAITATTRAPRAGEVDAVHYYFYSEEEFQKKIERDEFIEHAFVHGNHYGVPLLPVLACLREGKSVILNIDVQGMITIKQKLNDSMISFFLQPPSLEIWEERLRHRRTDSEHDIRMRLEEGKRELAMSHLYDYEIVNDDIDRAVDEVMSILDQRKLLQ